MSVEFESFKWEGSNSDGSGPLRAAFKLINPEWVKHLSGPATIKNHAYYSKTSLDAVLTNPKATWSPEDRDLLEQAQTSYPENNGAMK